MSGAPLVKLNQNTYPTESKPKSQFQTYALWISDQYIKYKKVYWSETIIDDGNRYKYSTKNWRYHQYFTDLAILYFKNFIKNMKRKFHFRFIKTKQVLYKTTAALGEENAGQN